MAAKWWPDRALASSRTMLIWARMSSWAKLPHARFASRIPCSAVIRRPLTIAAKPRCPSAALPAKTTNSMCAPAMMGWRCARGWQRSRAGRSTASPRNGRCPAIRWRGIRRILAVTREFSRTPAWRICRRPKKFPCRLPSLCRGAAMRWRRRRILRRHGRAVRDRSEEGPARRVRRVRPCRPSTGPSRWRR